MVLTASRGCAVTAAVPDPLLQAAVVSEVAQLMEAAGMQELLCLTKARIPVVKFEYRHASGAVKVRLRSGRQ